MRKNKLAAYLLASTIALTSCGNKEEKTITVDDLLCTEITYSEDEVLNNLEKIYDEYTNNQENFDLMGRDEILEAAILEHDIKDSNVNREEALKELNFLLECYIANYDMTEEEYIASFKTLSQTTLINVETYYPLAKIMHLYSCPLVHEEIDGVLICDNLEKKCFQTTVNGYYEFIVYSCTNNDNRNIRLPFLRLYTSKIDMDILLNELNSVYYFGRVPVDNIEEEWEFYFCNLESTLNDEESLFDTYYELAVYIHQLGCLYEHKVNEYNACVCDNMSLTKTREE